MRKIFLLSLILVPALTLRAEPLSVGSKAPTPTAPDQSGTPVDFSKVYAKGVTLVYFYPKAGTSGCTAEACSLRDSYTDLQGKGVQVIGVSADSVSDQSAFQQSNKLPFTLIADPDRKVAADFGVGKIMGIIPLDRRESFLVKDGKIAWHNANAATAGSAKEVEQALATLK